MTSTPHASSAPSSPLGRSQSIERPTYWWYVARSDLLRAALADHAGEGSGRALDVGSADGPSVAWLREGREVTALDLDPRGLRPGQDVRGSVTELPFADGSFDLVTAFDVVEHCEDEEAAVRELARVTRAGGRVLVSVPAYQWAWSDHDVRAGHHRRYTRPRAVQALERAGLRVDRATYAFGAVFPFFVAERAARRLRARRGGADPAQAGLTQVPGRVERLLLRLSRAESRWLDRRDVPFGSSVFLAATKP